MGDHDTLFSAFFPELWAALEGSGAESVGLKEAMGREWTWMMFGNTHFSLIHVYSALIAAVFLLVVAFRYRASLQNETQGVVPNRSWDLAAMADGFLRGVWQFACDVMGPKTAKTYFPFVATLALFIFACNIQGLIPGFLPATDTLKTNLALALMVFVLYNAVGIKENGVGHFVHFLGPKFALGGVEFRWLFWLMLPIEIASHLARPVSLSLRLMGNIMADHKVVGAVMGLHFVTSLLVPVPFLMLGTMVSIVQTVVFTLLTMIYIGEAAAHAEGH